MRYIAWNVEKNEQLKARRGISFEEAAFHIERDQILAVLDHPNQAKHPEQKIYVIQMEDYAYLVPFVKNEHEIFLKTVIPSRRATKKYLGGGDANA